MYHLKNIKKDLLFLLLMIDDDRNNPNPSSHLLKSVKA